MFRIKYYFTNCSIHGFHYITESHRHWTERVSWVLSCLAAAYYTKDYLLATWDAYQKNAVSFVMETDYLDWNTTFPAISICEQESPDKLYEAANELYGVDRNMNIDFYLRDIAFFDGTCFSCKTHCIEGGIKCIQNYTVIIQLIRAQCKDMIDNCFWNDKPFDCCANFLPLQTEIGTCFTINSVHTKKENDSLPQLITNRVTGTGKLQIKVYESVKLYLHSSEDVPYLNHHQDEKVLLNWGTDYTMRLRIKQIENDRNLPLISVRQRNCRFPYESNLDVYDYHSYSACIVDCRAKAQILLCNCTSHYMPPILNVKQCDIPGLACLSEYADSFRILQSKKLDKSGFSCECVSACNEPEYNVLMSNVEPRASAGDDDLYGTDISVSLDRLPTERFKRNVVRTRLDLVVSVGGTVGLFLGASMLSIVELFYYMFIRAYNYPEEADDEETNSDHESTESRTSLLLPTYKLHPELGKFIHFQNAHSHQSWS